MGNIIKLSPEFLAQLNDRGQLREWKRPEVISEEEKMKLQKEGRFIRRDKDGKTNTRN